MTAPAYPLHALDRAYSYVRAEAGRWTSRGPVYAIGESAGANIAANLALDHHVRRTALFAGVYDLRSWNADTGFWTQVVPEAWARRVRYSTSLRLDAARTREPLLVEHSPADSIAPIAGANAFVAAYRAHGGRITRHVLTGDHLADPDGLTDAIAYIRDGPPGSS